MDQRIPFVAWKGLLRAVEPHLLGPERLFAAENVSTRTGSIRTRAGMAVRRRVGPLQAGLWPVCLLTREAPILQWDVGADNLANTAVLADWLGLAKGPEQLREADEADGESLASYLEYSQDLPDWAELGGRVFVADGINPNMVLGTSRAHIRPMGVAPQTLSLAPAAAYNQSGNLTPGEQYTYGVQRVITVGALELSSPMALGVVTLTQTRSGYKIVCGTAGNLTPANWAAIENGYFRISVGGIGYAIGPVDLSGVSDFAGVAELLQTAIRIAGVSSDLLGLVEVAWVTNHFEISSPAALLALASVEGHTSSPDTDLSAAGWLNGQAATVTSPDNTSPSVTLTLEAYPYASPTGAAWSVSYRIWRSLATNSDVLYKVADLASVPEGGHYTDKKSDAELEATGISFDAAEADTNMQLPPVRYLRAWRGRLVGGGSARYSRGAASTVATNTVVELTTPGVVRSSDVGATLQIEGEDESYFVISVDTDNNRWTLDRACANTQAAARYVLCRENDVLYVSNPLPSNIEGFEAGSEVYSNTGSGNPLRGLAESNGYLFVFRETRVEVLEDSGNGYTLETIPGAPGTPSHATIADRYGSSIFYYAGLEGVWSLTGGRAEYLSAAMEELLRDQVDHGMDSHTHAVYDPSTGYYRLWLFDRGWSGPAIPQLCLVFDTRRGDWYVFRQYAVSSGIWKDAAGKLVPVIGVPDAVCQLDQNFSDGADVSGVVSSASSSSLTDATASFGSLAGLPVQVTDSAGNVQRRLVRSNTATAITIFGTWAQTPAAGATYHVGAIGWFAETGELSLFGPGENPELGKTKMFHRLVSIFEPDTAANPVTVSVRGVRAFAGRAISQVVDLNGREEVTLEGNKLGLRARSCVVRFSGSGTRPVALLGLTVEATDKTQ